MSESAIRRKVRVVFQPSGLRADLLPGTDLLTAARTAGLRIGGVCGGAGTCGRCRLFIVRGHRRVPVLACTYRLASPVTVEVPADAMAGAAHILEEGVFVKVEPLPAARLVSEGKRTILVLGEERTRHALKRRPGGCFGLAFDLGTTTLVASLFDLESGRRLAVASALNPQVALGEDVISRIGLAMAEKDGASRLRSMLVQKLNSLIRETCLKARVPPGEVFDLCAVGNTFMHHSFLGLPLRGLAEAPYLPALMRSRELTAADTGLRVNRIARAFLPPPLAGFLGSDALAGALAAGLDHAEAPTLYLDLGTNGEMLLAHDGNILGATSASGPAFEGAQIECGMRAAEGAVSAVKVVERGRGYRVRGIGHGGRGAGCRVRGRGRPRGSSRPRRALLVYGAGTNAGGREPVAGTSSGGGARGKGRMKIELTTIGGKTPRGIAGSGLVDAAAGLLDAGAIDRRGTLVRAHPLVKVEAKRPLVVLGARPRRIFLSQPDIRNLQLAKAAVAAGTKVLLERAGIEAEELDRVLLAGAFGNYMDPRSALRIGLLPPVEEESVLGLGNAASTGAGMMLVSTSERRRAMELAGKIEYIELAGNDRFRELFVECLAFP